MTLFPVYITASTAFLFYALIPVIGAFISRKQWKSFRLSVMEAKNLPILDNLNLQDELPEYCLAMGEIDAMEGENELWIKSGKFSFVMDLEDSLIFLLSDFKSGEDRVYRQNWKNLKTLSPGSRIFAIAKPEILEGRLILEKHQLVIIHDGEDKTVTRRAVWAGRHLNEYWNPLTQVSLIIGVAASGLLASISLGPRSPSLILSLLITIVFSPLLPLLPPGVLLFFLYRYNWRKAWYCRARRDVARLDQEKAAIIQSWNTKSLFATASSMLAFAVSVFLNGWIVVSLLWRFL